MEEIHPAANTGDQIPGEGPGHGPVDPGNDPDPESLISNSKKLTSMKVLSAVFNGLGIGLLLGILLGLSISPVVSGVIATLSSLLAILIGLNEKYLDPLKSIRIGSFGLFAVAGIILGLYLRANDPFAPSLLDKKNEYVAIGYSEEEAKALITVAITADTGITRRQAHVLYTSTIDAGACDELVYADDNTPPDEILNTFKGAGGAWRELAETFGADLTASVAGKALIAMRDCFCGMNESGVISLSITDQVKNIRKTDSLNAIENSLSSSDKKWKAIVVKVKEKVPENQRKEVYLSILKVFGDD